jgi:hypothetical protein
MPSIRTSAGCGVLPVVVENSGRLVTLASARSLVRLLPHPAKATIVIRKTFIQGTTHEIIRNGMRMYSQEVVKTGGLLRLNRNGLT